MARNTYRITYADNCETKQLEFLTENLEAAKTLLFATCPDARICSVDNITEKYKDCDFNA